MRDSLSRSLRSFLFCLLGLHLAGCATMPGRTSAEDPWQRFNRSVYRFNDAVDRAALKPMAKGYKKITPEWMRTGISNFFNNLEQPWVIVNELMQGKPKLMAQDTCRLVINTTLGVGGLIDVADRLGLTANDEDFGQTLAVWGVPSGPYLVLPFLGPSNLRDGPARIVGYYARPQRYVDLPWETQAGLTVLDVIDTRAKLLLVDDSLQNAFDKYGVVRDGWVQQREYRIYDGNPPEEKLDKDLEPEPEDEPSP